MLGLPVATNYGSKFMAASSIERNSNNAKRERTARVFGLDALRAAAILMVVSTHAFPAIYQQMPAWFGLIGHGGFYGVELFFVLSGFLIGQILIRYDLDLARAGTLVKFYLRRWFRTLPLFWLFLGLNVLLEVGFRSRSLSVSEVVSHGFFLRNFAANRMSFFGESWSLAIEEWFYLQIGRASCRERV